MYQRRYDKVYLMLRQEAAGYGLGSRAPWGSCVMELKNGKGKLSIQVQGLRPLPHTNYDVYALLEQPKGNQTAIHCAALHVDTQGSGTMEWDFSPDDMAGGYQAEDLFAVLITTTTQAKRIAPLTAYFGARREWRSCFTQADTTEITPKISQTNHINQTNIEETDICAAEALPITTANEKPFCKESVQNVISLPTETIQAVQQETHQEIPIETLHKRKIQKETEKKTQVQEIQKNTTNQTSYHGNFRGLLQKFRDEMTQLQEMGILSEEESQRILGTKTSSSPASQPVQPEQTEKKEQKEQKEETEERAEPAEMPQENLCDMQAAENSTPQTENAAKTENTQQPQTEQTEQTEQTKQTEQERTQARANALQQRTEQPQTDDTQAKETSNSNMDWEILSQNEILTPFADGAPWYCISLGELVLLPQAPLAWQKEPFFLLSYARYGHLILRKQEDGFLFGLPDTYESSARRRAEQLGFATFVRLPQQDTLGYWIGRL